MSQTVSRPEKTEDGFTILAPARTVRRNGAGSSLWTVAGQPEGTRHRARG